MFSHMHLVQKEVKKYSAYRCHTHTDNESNDEYECITEKKMDV